MATIGKRWTTNIGGGGLTAAVIQTFFTQVNDALINLGFSLAGGYGQWNMSVANIAPASNSIYGWRTYRFPPDPLTNTAPLFLRVGFYSNIGLTLGLTLICGYSSDDGGNLSSSVKSDYASQRMAGASTPYNSSSYINSSCLNYIVWDSDAGVVHFALGIGLFKVSSALPQYTPKNTPTSEANSLGYTCVGRGIDVQGAPRPDRLLSLTTNDGRGPYAYSVSGSFGFYWNGGIPALITYTVGDFKAKKTPNFLNGVWLNEDAPRLNGKLPVARIYTLWSDGSFIALPFVGGVGVDRMAPEGKSILDLTGGGAETFTYLHNSLALLDPASGFYDADGNYTYWTTTGKAPLIRWDGTLHV